MVGRSGPQVQQIAREIAASLDGASAGYPFTAHLEVWKVRGKVFLVVAEDDEAAALITVKADPYVADVLCREHESIEPGRYFNKHHWVSVGAGRDITRDLIEFLVTSSRGLVCGPVVEGGRR